MRHLSFTLPAPANRACVFAAHRGRSRRARSRLDGQFAIDRRARNQSQSRKSRERSQFAQVAGIPQCVMKEVFRTRNRNESHLTRSTGLTRRNVVMQDLRSAQGNKKSRSGGVHWMLGASCLVAWPNWRNSSAGVPRTAILHNVTSVGLHPPYELRRKFGQRGGLAKIAEKCPLCAHVFPIAEAAVEYRQSQGALAFMATERGTGQQRGEKRQK